MAEGLDYRTYVERRVATMHERRKPIYDHAHEIQYWMAPYHGVFSDKTGQTDSRDTGDKKLKHLINNAAIRARRICVSGIRAGVVSPARPWFKLEPFDPGMASFGPVRDYTYQVEEAMRESFLQSNFYPAVATAIAENTLFATASMGEMIGPTGIPVYYPHAFGTYYVAQNEYGVVDTFAVIKERRLEAIARQFGINKLPAHLKGRLENDKDARYKLVHFIEPNDNYDPDKLEAKYKRFRSVWYVQDQRDVPFLRESGFDEFPEHIIRWDLSGEYEYGVDSPGMIALGDNKALQEEEKEKAKAIQKMVSPVLQGPGNAREIPDYADKAGTFIMFDPDSRAQVSPVHTVDPRLNELRADMDAVERRINEAFFVDLFLAISSMQGVQPRNQLELSRRTEESLFILGPVLERYQSEFLLSILRRRFNSMYREGQLPPPPPEMEGRELNVRFISSLAQSQKAYEVAVLDDHVNFVALMSQYFPQAADKFNADAAIDARANFTGVVPNVVVSTDQANEMRQQRAEAQQQAASLEVAEKEAAINTQNAMAEQIEEA